MREDGWSIAGLLIVLAVLLYSCDSKTWTEDEIREIARASSPAPYQGGNTELTMQQGADIKELQGKVEFLQKQIDDIGTTLDRNAKTANENTLLEMNRRGACGQEWVALKDGGRVYRNKECTLKDLAH